MNNWVKIFFDNNKDNIWSMASSSMYIKLFLTIWLAFARTNHRAQESSVKSENIECPAEIDVFGV